MIRLTLNNGEEIYETKEILDLVEDIPTLTVQEKTSLEGEITLDEASVALKNMKNNKSPGSGGFTVESFNFWGGDSWVHSLLNH